MYDPAYHAPSQTAYARYDRHLGTIIKENLSGNILDAGCSAGLTTLRLARANPLATTYGMEIDPSLIMKGEELLRACAGQQELSRLKWIVGDFYQIGKHTQLRFKQIVFGNNFLYVMHHFSHTDLTTFFSTVYDRLDNNGHLALTRGENAISFTKSEEGQKLSFDAEVRTQQERCDTPDFELLKRVLDKKNVFDISYAGTNTHA